VKENRQGYHWAMLATPLNTMKMPPVTRARIPSRSTASAMRRPGGNDTNRGHTTQSLARSTGSEAIPQATCRPWVSRNSPAGRAGTGSQESGCWWMWENRPVTKQIVNRTPRLAPSQAARRSSRSGLR
jgi:hypothetical protein